MSAWPQITTSSPTVPGLDGHECDLESRWCSWGGMIGAPEALPTQDDHIKPGRQRVHSES